MSHFVCGDMEETRIRGLYRLLALNTEGDEPAEPARNLKAHQASSGTAGRRVSDFISSFSRLGRKITVIKKPDKYCVSLSRLGVFRGRFYLGPLISPSPSEGPASLS